MGNILGSKRSTKTEVTKITGETQVFKIPIQAHNILKNHPLHLSFESKREVQLQKITQTRPFLLHHNLLPHSCSHSHYSKSLVEVDSPAAARLEQLKQRRRKGLDDGVLRVRIRILKQEVETLVRECEDDEAAVERLLGLFMLASRQSATSGGHMRRLPPLSELVIRKE